MKISQMRLPWAMIMACLLFTGPVIAESTAEADESNHECPLKMKNGTGESDQLHQARPGLELKGNKKKLGCPYGTNPYGNFEGQQGSHILCIGTEAIASIRCKGKIVEFGKKHLGDAVDDDMIKAQNLDDLCVKFVPKGKYYLGKRVEPFVKTRKTSNKKKKKNKKSNLITK